MLAVGAAGGLTIATFAHWIVHLLYGTAYAEAAHLLQLAALASTLVFADVALTLLPIYMRKPQWIAIKWGLVLLITIIVDLVAIPRLGVRGAILGYAIANLLAMLFGAGIWLRQMPAGHTRRASACAAIVICAFTGPLIVIAEEGEDRCDDRKKHQQRDFVNIFIP
ncbi:hypothetical protein D9M72_545650 [compost metagenome]